jgi:hypothetical protein
MIEVGKTKKKTTNPALIRRYFKGKAEPGDYSEDFIIEPEYVLTYQGKLPYVPKFKFRQALVWRTFKGVFHCINELDKMETLEKFLPLIPPDIKKSPMNRAHALAFCNMRMMQLVKCTADQAEADSLIEMINETYALSTPGVLFERWNKNSNVFRPLFSKNCEIDITALDPDLIAYIMQRRLES